MMDKSLNGLTVFLMGVSVLTIVNNGDALPLPLVSLILLILCAFGWQRSIYYHQAYLREKATYQAHIRLIEQQVNAHDRLAEKKKRDDARFVEKGGTLRRSTTNWDSPLMEADEELSTDDSALRWVLIPKRIQAQAELSDAQAELRSRGLANWQRDADAIRGDWESVLGDWSKWSRSK